MGLGSDSALSRLIHSRLHSSLRLAYPTVALVQRKVVTRARNGEEVVEWIPVGAVRGNFSSVQVVGETRSVDLTMVRERFIFNLDGPYPFVRSTHTLWLNETRYNIVRVDEDSLGVAVRLELELTVN